VYFVTARHVLIDLQTHQPIAQQVELRSFSPDPSDKGQNILQVNLAQLQQAGALKIHPSADVAAFKVGSLSGDPKASQTLTFSSGVTQIKAASGIVGAPEETFQLFADVKISNDVYIFGYPDSLGLEQVPQLARDKPLLRSGIVAGTNPEKKTIVIDCPVFPGNSGGPVVEKDGFNLNNRRCHRICAIRQFKAAASTPLSHRCELRLFNRRPNGFRYRIA
jgi:Trypsin-like peptidase domain